MASTPATPRMRYPHARSQCSAAGRGGFPWARKAIDGAALHSGFRGPYETDLQPGTSTRAPRGSIRPHEMRKLVLGEQLLVPDEAAAFLSVSVETLAQWRSQRRGPVY